MIDLTPSPFKQKQESSIIIDEFLNIFKNKKKEKFSNIKK